MAYLVLVRHGKSEWNALGKWTGWTDIPLNEEGRNEAKQAGEQLRNIHFDQAYTSKLMRAQQTLDEIKQVIGQPDVTTTQNEALNERNYGDYTGKNKWEVQAQVGEEIFKKIRRSWDYPVPNGESLQDVSARVVPYYQHEILPKLQEGKNIIIAAHGNSLRALVKYLEHVSDTDISNLEIGTGEVYVYQINQNGEVVTKEIRSANPNKGKV